MGPPNYYHALGLPRLASPEQIRSAYVRLLKQGTANAAGPERLHLIQQAYRCLRDPETRTEHDRLLQARDVAHGRTVRRVQRRIRRFDRGRIVARNRRPAFGKLHALAAVSGGTVLLWLLLMG